MDFYAQQRETQTRNNEIAFSKLASTDPVQRKEAADAINAYTRTKMREESFLEKIIPSVEVTNEDLTRQVHTDKPVMVVDKEGDAPAAVSVPFATLPLNYYIRFPRYQVVFQRIVTPRFGKDVVELRTYEADIRQIISDNAIKDMLAEKDGKFIVALNACLIGPGQVMPTSGAAQYQQISGAITRESLADSLKIMPNTPFNLEVHTCLANTITAKELLKFGRDEMGGDKSQDIMLNGYSEDVLLGRRWIFTIKKDLVPTGAVYQFADPKYIGKHFSLEPDTMFIEQKAFMLEFYVYCCTGAAIGHTGGIARVDFTGVQ